MLFSDDLANISVFAELDDEINDVVVGENGDDEPHELKYTPVKTEIEDMLPPGASLTEDDIDDHFLNSFNNNTAGEVDGVMEEIDLAGWSEAPKKKKLPPGMARRGGMKRRDGRPNNERDSFKKTLKRAQMTPDERRDKWNVEAKVKRTKPKHHRELEDLLADVGQVNEDASPSKRPARQAKSRFLIKDEPESADEMILDDLDDEDYHVEDDDDEDYGSKKKKRGPRRKSTPRAKRGGRAPRTSRMSKSDVEVGEGVKEKRPRQRKGRKKKSDGDTEAAIKTEGDETGVEGEEGGKGKKKGGGRKRRSSSSGQGCNRRPGGSGRKRISEMTEEERAAMKAKWREEARIKRARQRETMTLHEREEYLRIQREKRREQRALAKITMTEEEKEQENKKARERKKAKRSLMTPEQRKEEAQKVTLRRIERLAHMTEDEKKMWKMNNYLQNMARMGRMSQEEIEERKRSRQEYAKRRRAQMTADDLERRRLMIKQYRDNMSPERRDRFLAKLREGYRRRLERLREDPGKWDEVKAKWKEDRLARKQKMKEMGENYVRRRKEPMTARRKYLRKADANETPEERMERIRESRRRTQRKIKLKKKLAMQKLLESGMSMDEIQQQIETPEQRERRLMRHRINRAKWNLRKRLENNGVPREEIEVKLKELHQTYQPTFTFRPYKPRPDSWKPVTETDLALLTEDIEKKPEILPPPPPVFIPRKPKASSSKSSTVGSSGPARRGRPPKVHVNNVQPPPPPPPPVVETITTATLGQPQAVATASSLTTTTVIISRGSVPTEIQLQPNSSLTFLAYPQPASSPAGASTCSYVSAAETPEPIHYSTPHQQQTHHLQQQFLSPQQQQQHGGQQYSTTQYHFQTQQIYPHQQPQAQPQQYTIPLQTILDNISFHDTTTTGTILPAGSATISNQVIYQQVVQPTQDTSSSHHGDYASSYDKHSLPASSPPPSPLAADDHDYSSGTFGDFPFQPPTSTESVRKRGRPRKDEPPRPKKPKGSKAGHRPGPRGPKKSNKTNVIRDMVCDECGNAYNHAYLREHKNQFHNPNYKNQTCQICGEKFNVARHWYTHYIRTHVEPTKDIKEKPHMCDVCGTSFRQKNNLDKHKYYMHGDGMKKENFKRCPVCPGEKLFKETVSLYAHLRRKHPGYNRGGHDCYRCDKSFPDEKELGLHVKAEHGDSYFPCQYCNACRFTKLGLNFHYFRCTKITKETRDEMRKQEGVFSLDRVPLPCEFCNRNVAVFSLTRHYWEMHNVKEDNFTCPDCGKEFRVREFWAVHMEEKHLRTLDQMTELVRSLNVANREGLVIKNPGGVKGGVPGNTPSKAAAQKRIELGVVKRGHIRVKEKAPKVKSRGGRIRKRQIVVTAEEEEDGMDSSASEEETDDDDDDDEEEEMKEDATSKKRPRRQIKVVAEEEDDDEEEEEQEVVRNTPVARQRRQRVGRKPGPKSKTRRRRKDDSEEDEDDEWRGSEDDEVYTPHKKTVSNLVSGERRSSTRPRNTPRKFRDDNSFSEEEQEEEDEEPDYSQSGDPYGDNRALTPVDEDELLEAVVKQEILSDGEEDYSPETVEVDVAQIRPPASPQPVDPSVYTDVAQINE